MQKVELTEAWVDMRVWIGEKEEKALTRDRIKEKKKSPAPSCPTQRALEINNKWTK